MRVIVGFLLLLGVVWVAKGVLAVARGHGTESWGDDFVHGGLILVVGVWIWRRLPRRVSA